MLNVRTMLLASLSIATPVYADINTAFDTILSSVEQTRNLSDALQEKLKAAEIALATTQTELSTKIEALETAKKQADADTETIKADAAHILVLQGEVLKRQDEVNALKTDLAAQKTLVAKLRAFAPAPTAILTATPSTIKLGESSTLKLDATNYEVCLTTDWDMQNPVVFPKVTTEYKGECAGLNGTILSFAATVEVEVPPPSSVVTNPNNTVKITNVSGNSTQYSYTFGRGFKQGEITGAPEVLVDGKPGPGQMVVKNRWPDNSVKTAVGAADIALLPTNTPVVLTFADKPVVSRVSPGKEELLALFPNFDATIQLTLSDGTVQTVSARDMLEKGYCASWMVVPAATTLRCADRSVDRVYDRGPPAWRSFHPEFVLTFWNKTGQVAVRYAGEVSNSQALGAFSYDLVLTIGKNSPVTIYQQAGIKHSIGTRWTRTAWFGGASESKVNIDHNVGYLADTKLIPNFDRSVKVSGAVIAEEYDWFQKNADLKIGGAGRWRKSTPDPGERADIGPTTSWSARAVFSDDWRARQIMLWQADQAGAWPLNIREGNPAKFADREGKIIGLGKPVSVYARPTSWYLDMRAPGTAADKLTILSPAGTGGNPDLYDYGGWVADDAHRPDPYFFPYLLTGDPFYLDGLQLWAGQGGFSTSPGLGASSRGPGAGIFSQVRAQAWIFRDRINAAAATPDDDPMKGVFTTMVNDAIAKWEGQRDIRGTAFENTPMWKFGRSFLGTSGDGWSGYGIPPLHWWQDGPGYAATDPAYYDVNVVLSAAAHWMHNYLLLELGRAVELGFPADAIFKWSADNLIGQLTDPGYNRTLVSQYVVPNMKKGPLNSAGKPTPLWFQSWSETLTAWSTQPNISFPPNMQNTQTLYNGKDENGSTFIVARAAAGIVADVLGRPDVWAWIGPAGSGLTVQNDPRWAIVARTKQ